VGRQEYFDAKYDLSKGQFLIFLTYR